MPDSSIDRDRLLAYLAEHRERPFSARELARGLEIGTEDYRAFRRLLRELEASGDVFRQPGK